MNKNFSNQFADHQLAKQFAWANIFGIFGLTSLLTRTVFLIRAHSEINFSVILLAKIYLGGLFFDLITISYLAFIPLLYYLLIPGKFFTKKLHTYFVLLLYFLFIYGIVFNAFAEWFFWGEFASRYNSIAVDYLIHNTKTGSPYLGGASLPQQTMGALISNFAKSHSWLMAWILLIDAAIFFFSYKNIFENIKKKINWQNRSQLSLSPLLICVIAFFTVDSHKIASKISDNHYVQQISYNGIYQLFSAYHTQNLPLLQNRGVF